MKLEEFLANNRAEILTRWRELVASEYPSGLNLFKDKDRFTNPVGHAFSSETKALYDELLQPKPDPAKISTALDAILRIRAVQDFPPGQAVGFIFLLKKAIRDQISGEFQDNMSLRELMDFECMIDDVACLAFDTYTRCREKLHEIRIGQIKAEKENAFRLMQRILAKHEELAGTITDVYNNGSKGAE